MTDEKTVKSINRSKSLTKSEALQVFGSVGTVAEFGRIKDEWLRRIARNKVGFYEEIGDNSPVAGAILLAVRLAIARNPPKVKSGKEDASNAVAAADFLTSCLEDMSQDFGATLGNAVAEMIRYGFYPYEMVFKVRGGESDNPRLSSKFSDGKIGIRKLGARPPKTIAGWDLDPADKGVRGIWQKIDGKRVYIPVRKLLIFRTENVSPEGKSWFRPMALPYIEGRLYSDIEGVGIARNLVGMPILEVPPQVAEKQNSENGTELSEYEELVKDLKTDERMGVVIPAEVYEGKETGYKLRLLESPGSTPIDVSETIKRCDTRQAMPMWAGSLFIGMDGTGTQSADKSKAEMFLKVIDGAYQIGEDIVNRFLIPPLMRMNGFPPELDPYIEHEPIDGMDAKEWAEFVSQLTANHILIPGEEMDMAAREKGRLPLPELSDPIRDANIAAINPPTNPDNPNNNEGDNVDQ